MLLDAPTLQEHTGNEGIEQALSEGQRIHFALRFAPRVHEFLEHLFYLECEQRCGQHSNTWWVARQLPAYPYVGKKKLKN